MTNISKSFKPGITPTEFMGSGIQSFIDWNKLLPYLNQAFHIKINERIVGIVATDEGIKARIEYIK